MRNFLSLLHKTLLLLTLTFAATGEAAEDNDPIQMLDLDIVSYEDFIRDDPETLSIVHKALYERGIVGIRGIPEFKEKFQQYIQAAREFTALPESIKDACAPNHALGETFLGYEAGKEKFMRPDGSWYIDDLKVSYYAFVPDIPTNKWCREFDLRTPFQEIGALMSSVGVLVMQKIGFAGPNTSISLEDVPHLGRMLYYRKSGNSGKDNPFWCGAHYDHGIFTALLPAVYFENGEVISEPMEAGLFVRIPSETSFRKVKADDMDVMMFQVGEFGQLATNDEIIATEHRVHKAPGNIERYTMALFFDVPFTTVLHSTSLLTQDARYGGAAGDPCTFRDWKVRTFERFLHKDK